MVFLSSIGCHLMSLLGFVDSRGCEELSPRFPDEAPDSTVMWLKLLFVPALGILILVIFLLEDYCYQSKELSEFDSASSFASSQQQNQTNQHINVHNHMQLANHNGAANSLTSHPQSLSSVPSSAQSVVPSGSAKSRSKRSSNSLFWRRNNSKALPPLTAGTILPANITSSQSLSGVSPSHPHSHSHSHSHALSPPASSAPLPSIPAQFLTPGTRIFLTTEYGITSVYRLSSSISVRDLIIYHCGRNSISPDGLFLSQAGKRIPDSMILQVGPDSMHFTLEVDLSVLSVQLESECQRDLSQLTSAIDKENKLINELECELADCIESVVEYQTQIQSMELELDELIRQKTCLMGELESIQAESNELKKVKKQREEAKLAVENELIVPQSKERNRVEKQVKEAKFTIHQSTNEIEELNLSISKKTREIVEMEGKIKENNSRTEWIQREIAREKEKAERLSVVTVAVEALEREKEEIQRKKKEVEMLERELEEQEKELAAHKNFLQSTLQSGAASAVAAASLSSNNQAELIDQQIAMQKNKFKQLESAAKDLTKWKALAAKFESEAKEWSKMKVIVKQTKIREKLLEKDLKDSGHWRHRVRAFDKELKELRAFRRHAVELSALKNWSIPQPPVINENEIDNAPVSAYSAAFEAEWPDSASASSSLLHPNGEMKGDSFFDSSSGSIPNSGSGSEDALPPVHLATAAAAMSAALTSDRASGSSMGQRFYGSTLQPSAREFVPRTSMANSSMQFNSAPGNQAFSNAPNAASPTLGPFFQSNWGPEFSSANPLNAPLSSKPGLLIIDDRAQSTQPAVNGSSALSALNASSLELGAFNSSLATSNSSPPLLNQPAPNLSLPGLASLSQLSSQLASVLSALNTTPQQGNGQNGSILPE